MIQNVNDSLRELFSIGDWQSLRAALDKRIDNDISDVPSTLRLANLCAYEGLYEQALELYETSTC